MHFPLEGSNFRSLVETQASFWLWGGPTDPAWPALVPLLPPSTGMGISWAHMPSPVLLLHKCWGTNSLGLFCKGWVCPCPRLPAPGSQASWPCVEPATCGQLWQAGESIWLFGSCLLFKHLFSKKDAELSSYIVQDACGTGFLNQDTAAKLHLSKRQSVSKDSETPSSSLLTLQ